MLRKNTSGQNITFALINASTGAALTGATVSKYRSIDGGAQATATGTVTELGNGQYNFALSQADTNGNQIGLLFTATGAIPVCITIVTTAANPTDAAAFGLTNLDAAVSTRSTYAGADTSGTTTLLSRLTSTRAGNLDNLDAAVSSRSTYAGGDTAGTTTLLSRLTSTRAGNLDNLDATISSRLATSGYTAPTTPPTVAQIRTEMDSNSTKLANLDAAVSSRLASGSYTAPDNATISSISSAVATVSTNVSTVSSSVTAVKAVTDTLSLNGIADAILKRDWTAVSGEASRSVLNALRAIRNKVSRVSGAVYKEDDATQAWTFTQTTDASANPITEVDPS